MSHHDLAFEILSKPRHDITWLCEAITNGADVNKPFITSDYLMYPLHAAVMVRRPDMVQYLHTHGADLNVKNESNFTPLNLALRNHSAFECALYLLDAGADLENVSLHLVINPKLLTRLIQRGVSVDADWYKPYFQADLAGAPCQKDTPLHILARCVFNDMDECTNILCQAGANVNAVNALGNTPLHYATNSVFLNRLKLISALLLNGADPLIPNHLGQTAMTFNPNVEADVIELISRYVLFREVCRIWGFTLGLDLYSQWPPEEVVKDIMELCGMGEWAHDLFILSKAI